MKLTIKDFKLQTKDLPDDTILLFKLGHRAISNLVKQKDTIITLGRFNKILDNIQDNTLLAIYDNADNKWFNINLFVSTKLDKKSNGDIFIKQRFLTLEATEEKQ